MRCVAGYISPNRSLKTRSQSSCRPSDPLQMINMWLSESTFPPQQTFVNSRFHAAAGGRKIVMRFCSCRLQWCITFLSTLPQYNQTSHLKAPWSDCFSSLLFPCLWATPLTASSSGSDAAARRQTQRERSLTSALQRSASQRHSGSTLSKKNSVCLERPQDVLLQLSKDFTSRHLLRLIFVRVLCVMRLYWRYSHLSLPTGCQSYWSEHAPLPLHLSLAGPAGKKQSDGRKHKRSHTLTS